jgi:hypothetical protein
VNPIDLYDHEIIAIDGVLEKLRFKQGHRHNYNDLEREIRERFAEIGLVVSVTWREYAIGGVKQEGAMPDITPVARTEPHEFDHDRQVHEVTHNILDIPGQEGVIKTDESGTFRKFREEHGNNHPHSHGHGHGHGHTHSH